MLSEERKSELVKQATKAANESRNTFKKWMYSLSPEEAQFIINNAFGKSEQIIMIIVPVETNNPDAS